MLKYVDFLSIEKAKIQSSPWSREGYFGRLRVWLWLDFKQDYHSYIIRLYSTSLPHSVFYYCLTYTVLFLLVVMHKY